MMAYQVSILYQFVLFYVLRTPGLLSQSKLEKERNDSVGLAQVQREEPRTPLVTTTAIYRTLSQYIPKAKLLNTFPRGPGR